MTSATTNRQSHEDLLADLRDRLGRAAQGGGEKARARHLERGKLLARQRIDVLLDPGSPFLELSPLAAEEMYGGKAPGAGVVTGIGRVSGRECRSEEHTSELQSRFDLVCRLLLEKK